MISLVLSLYIKGSIVADVIIDRHLQRLRSENRLLRQRIENLEKENGTLADRLIQGEKATPLYNLT